MVIGIMRLGISSPLGIRDTLSVSKPDDIDATVGVALDRSSIVIGASVTSGVSLVVVSDTSVIGVALDRDSIVTGTRPTSDSTVGVGVGVTSDSTVVSDTGVGVTSDSTVGVGTTVVSAEIMIDNESGSTDGVGINRLEPSDGAISTSEEIEKAA